jgi:hypothetical protein
MMPLAPAVDCGDQEQPLLEPVLQVINGLLRVREADPFLDRQMAVDVRQRSKLQGAPVEVEGELPNPLESEFLSDDGDRGRVRRERLHDRERFCFRGAGNLEIIRRQGSFTYRSSWVIMFFMVSITVEPHSRFQQSMES